MLIVNPVKRDDKLYPEYAKRFQSSGIEEPFVLQLLEDEKALGCIVCRAEDIYMCILGIDIKEECQHLLEFFLKSVCVFAQNRNKFTLKCSNRDFFETLTPFASTQNEGELYIDTISLTTSCTRCE